MQFNALLVLAATATLGLAQSDGCTYQTNDFASTCRQGDTVFCGTSSGGDQGVCDRNPVTPKIESFDAEATARNEEACVGKSVGEACTQTALCCLASS